MFRAISCLIQMLSLLDLKKFYPFRAMILNQDMHLSKMLKCHKNEYYIFNKMSEFDHQIINVHHIYLTV